MKSTLLFIFGMIGVFGSPAARGTHDNIARAPAAPRELEVENSVNGARSPNSLAASDVPWACIVVNKDSRNYGDGLGTSQGGALATARYACPGNCEQQLCVTGGCVAYASGPQYVELYSAVNYGSMQADQTAAQNGALTACQTHSSGCGVVVILCTSNAT